MKLNHYFLAIFISILWGFNFVAVKHALNELPIFLMLVLRLIIVTIFLIPFLNKPRISILRLFSISLTLSILHFSLMFASLNKGLDASVAVITDQLKVPIAVILGYLILGEKIKLKRIIGICIAFCGIITLYGTPNVDNNNLAFFLLIASSIAWAFYNIQIKNMPDMNIFSFIFWISILALPILISISLTFEKDHIQILKNLSLSTIFALLYTSIFATLIAQGSWYFLIKKYKISKVVPFSLLMPIFGIIASSFFLQEHISLKIIISAIITIFGVSIVVFNFNKFSFRTR